MGSGSGGRKQMGGGGMGSDPCGRPHRKLESTDVILSSFHAKKLVVHFMSMACGCPQGGGD